MIPMRGKRGIWIAPVLLIVVTLLVMEWSLPIGLLVLIASSVLLWRYYRIVRKTYQPDPVPDPTATRDQGRTIMIELVDEHGNALAPEEAERRLAVARAEAGPRDTVIPAPSPSRW